MNDKQLTDIPDIHGRIEAKKREIDFDMPSDLYIGSLLKTLISSKQNANVLELGTGIGLSLAWMIDGLSKSSALTSIDNNPELTAIAKEFFGKVENVTIVCEDGSKWIQEYTGGKFDLIFADAWPGKYSGTDAALDLVNEGGFYVIDDMSYQPNWPDGHQQNVDALIIHLEKRTDFTMTKMNWSTGIIIMTKKYN